MILVDTSVWVDHLRRRDASLHALLEAGKVLIHPFVIGEIACGKLRSRRTILDHLGRLPSSPVATDAEALELIERRSLGGTGIGYLDVHLLAATVLASSRLWTRDRRLHSVARRLNVSFGEGVSPE